MPDESIEFMPSKPSKIGWKEVTSWNSVGWYVALLVGIWGALMGVGQYYLADLFFSFAIILFCVKWGHFTQIHNLNRRRLLFLTGVIPAIALMVVTIVWSRSQERDAKKRETELSRLSLIPGLQDQVNKIPELQVKIDELTTKSNQDAAGLSSKQDMIEKLTNTVISQQNIIAIDAQKELAAAATDIKQHIEQQGASIASNLDLYRADAESVHASGMHPDRRLSPNQISALTKAISDSSCDPTQALAQGVHVEAFVNVLWVTETEAAGYASDFVSALSANKTGTCGVFAFRDSFVPRGRIKGVLLFSPDWNHPAKIATLLKDAFDQSHIPYILGNGPVGEFTKYGVFIVIGAK